MIYNYNGNNWFSTAIFSDRRRRKRHSDHDDLLLYRTMVVLNSLAVVAFVIMVTLYMIDIFLGGNYC